MVCMHRSGMGECERGSMMVAMVRLLMRGPLLLDVVL